MLTTAEPGSHCAPTGPTSTIPIDHYAERTNRETIRDLEELLFDAKKLISQRGKRRAAALMLAQYAKHRIMGGAEPENGDVKFVTAIVALGDVADTLSAALLP